MEKTLKRHILDVFMAPRSVAIVGASRKTGEESFNVIENMRKFGYKGKIYPVNPSANKIMGMKSYKDIILNPQIEGEILYSESGRRAYGN